MKPTVEKALAGMLERDGKLVASVVVKAASKKSSPLHDQFEWDDAKAADQHRLWRARQLIKQFSVQIVEPERKLVHVPPQVTDGGREGEYRPAKSLLDSPSDYERAMTEALANLAAAKRAVALLEDLATKAGGADDRVAVLAVAMRGLDTAQTALKSLH